MADLPDALVLPTLLSRVAMLTVSKQRMVLSCLSLIEKESGDGAEPAWLSALLAQPFLKPLPAVEASAVPQPPAPAMSLTEAQDVSSIPPQATPAVAHAPEHVATNKAAPELPSTEAQPAEPAASQITIRVFSTYGTGTSVGLTEVSAGRTVVQVASVLLPVAFLLCLALTREHD
jgi:hypothetical protein